MDIKELKGKISSLVFFVSDIRCKVRTLIPFTEEELEKLKKLCSQIDELALTESFYNGFLFQELKSINEFYGKRNEGSIFNEKDITLFLKTIFETLETEKQLNQMQYNLTVQLKSHLIELTNENKNHILFPVLSKINNVIRKHNKTIYGTLETIIS